MVDTSILMDAATIVAVIVGLTQIAKELGVPTKYIPAIAVALGVGVPYLPQLVFQGLIYGLSATGLFRAGKTLVTNTSEPIPIPAAPVEIP